MPFTEGQRARGMYPRRGVAELKSVSNEPNRVQLDVP